MISIKGLVTFALVSSGYAYTFVTTGLDPPDQDLILKYGVLSSPLECALKCLSDQLCYGYKYNESVCQGVPMSRASNASDSNAYNQFQVLQYHTSPECVYGPYGEAAGGIPFNFSVSSDRGPIKRIFVYWHIWITGLTIQYSDGSNESLLHGIPTNQKTFDIPDGETITYTAVKYCTRVDSILFNTDKGTDSGRLGGHFGTKVEHIRGFGLQGILGEYIEGSSFTSGIKRMSFAFSRCP